MVAGDDSTAETDSGRRFGIARQPRRAWKTTNVLTRERATSLRFWGALTAQAKYRRKSKPRTSMYNTSFVHISQSPAGLQ